MFNLKALSEPLTSGLLKTLTLQLPNLFFSSPSTDAESNKKLDTIKQLYTTLHKQLTSTEFNEFNKKLIKIVRADTHYATRPIKTFFFSHKKNSTSNEAPINEVAKFLLGTRKLEKKHQDEILDLLTQKIAELLWRSKTTTPKR